MDDFERLTGLDLQGESGGLTEDLPPIQRWLNRILALRIALQNAIFDEYLGRSEEHTSELQSLMRISYAVFCLKKKKKNNDTQRNIYNTPASTPPQSSDKT